MAGDFLKDLFPEEDFGFKQRGTEAEKSLEVISDRDFRLPDGTIGALPGVTALGGVSLDDNGEPQIDSGLIQAKADALQSYVDSGNIRYEATGGETEDGVPIYEIYRGEGEGDRISDFILDNQLDGLANLYGKPSKYEMNKEGQALRSRISSVRQAQSVLANPMDYTNLTGFGHTDNAFATGLSRGKDNMDASLYRSVEAAGQFFGLRGMKEWGYRGATDNEMAANFLESSTNRIEDVDLTSPGSVWEYATGMLGESLPQMLPYFVPGFGQAGAVVRGTATVARVGLPFMQHFGEAVGEQEGVVSEKELAPALFAALINYGLDRTGNAAIKGTFTPKDLANPKGWDKLVSKVAVNMGTTPLKAAEVLTTTALESLTEGMQELTLIGSAMYAEDRSLDEAFDYITSEEGISRLKNSVAAGGIVGGQLSTGGALVSAGRDRLAKKAKESRDKLSKVRGEEIAKNDTRKSTVDNAREQAHKERELQAVREEEYNRKAEESVEEFKGTQWYEQKKADALNEIRTVERTKFRTEQKKAKRAARLAFFKRVTTNPEALRNFFLSDVHTSLTHAFRMEDIPKGKLRDKIGVLIGTVASSSQAWAKDDSIEAKKRTSGGEFDVKLVDMEAEYTTVFKKTPEQFEETLGNYLRWRALDDKSQYVGPDAELFADGTAESAVLSKVDTMFARESTRDKENDSTYEERDGYVDSGVTPYDLKEISENTEEAATIISEEFSEVFSYDAALKWVEEWTNPSKNPEEALDELRTRTRTPGSRKGKGKVGFSKNARFVNRFGRKDVVEALKERNKERADFSWQKVMIGQDDRIILNQLNEIKDEMGDDFSPEGEYLLRELLDRQANRMEIPEWLTKFNYVLGNVAALVMLPGVVISSIPEIPLAWSNSKKKDGTGKSLEDDVVDASKIFIEPIRKAILQSVQAKGYASYNDMANNFGTRLLTRSGANKTKLQLQHHLGNDAGVADGWLSWAVQGMFTVTGLGALTNGVRKIAMVNSFTGITNDVMIWAEYRTSGREYPTDGELKARQRMVEARMDPEVDSIEVQKALEKDALLVLENPTHSGMTDTEYRDTILAQTRSREALRDSDTQYYNAMNKLETAAVRVSEELVALPTLDSRPLWYSNPYFKFTGLFMTFISTMTAKVIPNLYRRAKSTDPELQYETFKTVVLMHALSALALAMKGAIYSWEDEEDDLRSARKIISGTGLLGTVDRGIGVLFPMYDQRTPIVGRAVKDFLGPGTELVERGYGVGSGVAQGDTDKVLQNIARLIPGVKQQRDAREWVSTLAQEE